MIWDTIIVGSGSAGATAGLYLSRACLKNLLFTGDQRGGLLTTTHIVENFPGIFPAISGPELMEIMINQAASFGTEIKEEFVTHVSYENNGHHNIFTLTTRDNVYEAKSIVWATGSTPKMLNIPGEIELNNKGVSYCAVCDAFFYKNQDVAVVGGGNTALEEALFLSNVVNKVHLIHRRDEFRGEKILYEQVKNNPKITIHYWSVVESINGSEGVDNITIKNLQDNTISTLYVNGIFIAIGHKPNTAIIKDIINLDDDGYVLGHYGKTNLEGFFVAGDVQDHIYRQAVTAAGAGCIAALEIIKYLKNLGI